MLYYWIPKASFEALFTYFGPKFNLGSVWLAPMFGIVGNIPGGEDSPMFTLWAGGGQGQLSYFVGGDIYVDSDGQQAGDDSFIHYLYGSVDYAINEWLGAGFQAEEFDGLLRVGPQVAVSRGPWKLVAQWHHWNEDLGDAPSPPTGNFIRLNTFLSF